MISVYGISTIVGYLMPNPVFTYLLNIWFVNTFCRYMQLNDQTVPFLTISSSSSWRAASTDIPDPLSPRLPIIHRLRRSSGLHHVSSHSCCMNVRVGRPAFDWPYAGVHRSTSLTISSLLLQQCPACLVRLTI